MAHPFISISNFVTRKADEIGLKFTPKHNKVVKGYEITLPKWTDDKNQCRVRIVCHWQSLKPYYLNHITIKIC